MIHKITAFLEVEAPTLEEAITSVNVRCSMYFKTKIVTEEKVEEMAEEVRIGVLKRKLGIVGIEPANAGDPVYDTGSKYRIYMDNAKKAVDYYKSTLLPEIIFDQNFLK